MQASQTTNGQIPLVFIHGAWLSARSWEKYVDYFDKRGFAVSAPEWPRKQGEIEEIRETADEIAGLGVQEIVDQICPRRPPGDTRAAGRGAHRGGRRSGRLSARPPGPEERNADERSGR